MDNIWILTLIKFVKGFYGLMTNGRVLVPCLFQAISICGILLELALHYSWLYFPFFSRFILHNFMLTFDPLWIRIIFLWVSPNILPNLFHFFNKRFFFFTSISSFLIFFFINKNNKAFHMVLSSVSLITVLFKNYLDW